MQVLFRILQNSYFLRDNDNLDSENVCILLRKRLKGKLFCPKAGEIRGHFSWVNKKFSENLKKPLAIQIDL